MINEISINNLFFQRAKFRCATIPRILLYNISFVRLVLINKLLF